MGGKPAPLNNFDLSLVTNMQTCSLRGSTMMATTMLATTMTGTIHDNHGKVYPTMS